MVSISGAALIAFPMTFGVSAIANDFVPAFLEEVMIKARNC